MRINAERIRTKVADLVLALIADAAIAKLSVGTVLYVPRYSGAGMPAPSSALAGSVVYNTTTGTLWFYDAVMVHELAIAE